MKDLPIKKFGSKLMVSSKSINKIPEEYLQLAQNARIYDWWIGPARGKELLISSTLWTNNKGAFVMNNTLYQIANSRIYEIDESAWTQTEIVSLWYDSRVDTLVYWNDFTIIASEWQTLKVFDWTATLITPWSVPSWTPGGIIEYTRWFTFYAIWNILYISRPITSANPEYAYDFTGSWSENINYDSEITALQSTMNWLYVFTKDKVEYIWANSLQNIAWSATFISTPLWVWGEPVNNQAVTASGDKIFYITKTQEVRTINYIAGTADPTIWELSAVPVIGIKELLDTISPTQPTAFAFENENDNTVQFHLRTNTAWFNDICIVYDLINQTRAIDKWKNYNYVVKKINEYFWFSDINSSIYKDDFWETMAWSAIPFKIITQYLNQWTILQKLYWWLFTAWAIWPFTKLDYIARIDWEAIFSESIEWTTNLQEEIWDIWWNSIWWEPIWWDITYNQNLQIFDRIADEWRIYQHWKRIQIEIRSSSLIQNFIIDILWIRAESTQHSNISDKF